LALGQVARDHLLSRERTQDADEFVVVSHTSPFLGVFTKFALLGYLLGGAAAAAGVLRQLRSERPSLLLGAGTVLDRETLHLAKECGAQFALAPGFNPPVAAEALKIGLPFAPGIATPSEAEQAMTLGIKVLKFFPAGDAGGPRLLRSLSGPYGHTGVRFIPTGGVNLENLREYLAVPTVIAVGGTWIASREAIKAEQWDTIRSNCRQIVELIGALD
jgi:2-dehydro-3-deoxyphosphogluconate aldolase/(4S)-4-hydroxy-2-oxoglutarate aldolase